jgi:hypothetical protein
MVFWILWRLGWCGRPYTQLFLYAPNGNYHRVFDFYNWLDGVASLFSSCGGRKRDRELYLSPRVCQPFLWRLTITISEERSLRRTLACSYPLEDTIRDSGVFHWNLQRA